MTRGHDEEQAAPEGVTERDPVHAPGKRHKGPAPGSRRSKGPKIPPAHHQPWVPTSGLVGRKRRSPHQ